MNVEIAQRLAELRREKGYSQEELAESLGLSRQAVSKWERAESSPDTGNLIALAKLYKVTLDELLRTEADIEDDVKFESQDRIVSTESQAQIAADRASQAAAQAAAAAATAQAATAQAVPVQAYASPMQQPPYPAPPVPPQPEKKKVGPWITFPYPIICVIVFLFAGFFWASWHPAWVIFLTIPLYYWIANIIENDPNYRK